MTPLFGRKRRSQDDCRLHVRDGSVHEEGGRIDFADCRGGLDEASSRAQCALEEIRARRRAVIASLGRYAPREGRPVTTTNRWTLGTNAITLSPTIERGTVGVNLQTIDDIGAYPCDSAFVRFAGRSKRMRLQISPHLGIDDVELCREDMDDLGISDGAKGMVELVSEEALQAMAVAEMGGRMGPGTGAPRKIKVPARHRFESDCDTPPYTVDSGLGFWRRRKRG